MIMLKKLATEYFNYFSKKSITEIEKALSENVTLNDWNISCSGKSEVIGATQNIFDSVDTIDVKPINIYCCKDVILIESSSPEVDDVIRIEDDTLRGDGRIQIEHDLGSG